MSPVSFSFTPRFGLVIEFWWTETARRFGPGASTASFKMVCFEKSLPFPWDAENKSHVSALPDGMFLLAIRCPFK